MDESPPVVDLYLHTTALDGRFTIDTFPNTARVGGVDVVAVTDHSRYHLELDAPIVECDSIAIVRGIELRVDAGDRRVGLLGYGLRERPALVEAAERFQRNRVERTREIVAAIEEETGVRLEIDIHDGVDWPHVAHAVDTSEAPYDYQGAFDELIGADDPCYVTYGLPTFDNGVATLRDACDAVGFAHPFRYRDPAGAFELYVNPDAVEHYYPYGLDAGTDLVEEAVGHYGLLATGGNDTHDETLGRAGPSKADFARFTTAVDSL